MPRRAPAPRRVDNGLLLARTLEDVDHLLKRLLTIGRELEYNATAVRGLTMQVDACLDDIRRLHRRVEEDLAATRRGER